jgi:hypothetical protein
MRHDHILPILIACSWGFLEDMIQSGQLPYGLLAVQGAFITYLIIRLVILRARVEHCENQIVEMYCDQTTITQRLKRLEKSPKFVSPAPLDDGVPDSADLEQLFPTHPEE